MIYKIRPSEKKHEKREPKKLRRAGANSPRRLYGYRIDEIDISMLFELAMLDGATDEPKKRRKSRFTNRSKEIFLFPFRVIVRSGHVIYQTALRVLNFLKRKTRELIDKRKKRKSLPSILPTLTGTLVGILIVTAISALAVLYKLFISNYYGRYYTTRVPEMIGVSYADAREMLDGDSESYNIRVSYEYSDDIPEGTVIKQNPEGGVERRIYFGDELPTVSIVVSRGKQSFVMPDYCGRNGRDASLELKNMGISVSFKEIFSSKVESGKVISSIPAAGESFYIDQTVLLTVSRGEEKKYARVPDVVGFSENKATALVTASGLGLGEVSYQSSTAPIGTVISQSIKPYTSVEFGEKLSLVVSAGSLFDEKKVPSLYGKTLNEAREALSAYGLVLGNIYAVKSSEPSGTVISQSPKANTTINSTIIGVDIYVSS